MVRETVIENEGDFPHPEIPEMNAPQFSSPGEFHADDQNFDEALRPQRLSDVVGQRKVVERLKIILDATRKREEALGHLLLDGPPGLGKTTLATVMARELNSEIQITSGPALVAPRDLIPYLTNASEGSVLFIDEIHRLPPSVEEFLYPAMEDFRVDIALGEGMNARTISMSLAKFTVVGATTRSGMLTAPLRDRFVTREHLDFYDHEDLTEIATINAKKLRTTITPEAANDIATRSRGTPRKANNLLRWARDYATSKADGEITTEVARSAFEMLEVDEIGLESQDRRYLRTLINVFSGGPAGLQALAHSLNISADTLEDEVEPFLLRQGLIQRTPRGRMITPAAFQHLDIPLEPGDPSGSNDPKLF